MSIQTQSPARLRSALANVAGAVEDRVILGGAELLRGIFGVVRWPFERIAWAIEEWLVWPIGERVAGWSPALRRSATAMVAVVAIAAGTAGVLWASSGDEAATPLATEPAGLPIDTKPIAKSEAPATPLLKGAAPVFEPEGDRGVPKAAAANAVPASAGAAGAGAQTSKPATAKPAITAPGGPAAMKVARRFAGAFVLYETGRGGDETRAAIRETAMPRLARSLLRRPPRLPADVVVPKAKVLNLVPGPRLGAIFTVSASLLRVGVTNELRIDLQKNRDGPRVVSVLG